MRQISHSIFQSLILRFQVSVSTAIGALNCLEFSYEKFSCESNRQNEIISNRVRGATSSSFRGGAISLLGREHAKFVKEIRRKN